MFRSRRARRTETTDRSRTTRRQPSLLAALRELTLPRRQRRVFAVSLAVALAGGALLASSAIADPADTSAVTTTSAVPATAAVTELATTATTGTTAEPTSTSSTTDAATTTTTVVDPATTTTSTTATTAPDAAATAQRVALFGYLLALRQADLGAHVIRRSPPPTTTTTAAPVSHPAADHMHPFLVCTRAHESSHVPPAYETGYGAVSPGGTYRGAYQFLRSTWNSTAAAAGRPDLVGVDPAAASVADQDYLAFSLYTWSGARPWNGRCAGR